MENKIVAHLKNGEVHKGMTHDFDPTGEAFHVLPAEGGGVPVRVRLEDMKALFYVKDYLGNRDFVARQKFDQAKRSGQKAVLTFLDDESMWGTIPEGIEDAAPGFFFFPVDEEDNNIRIYVVRSSLKDLRLVS